MVARRIMWMPPTLFGLVLIVFAISHVIPSDPARVMAGENAPAEQVQVLRHKYGLDLPLPQQFLRYVGDTATGNMGTSLFTQRPVAEDLWSRLPATLELALYAMVIAVVAGVPLGVVAAVRRNSLLDHVVRVATITGLAMAAFWLAILLQLLFSMWLGLTPVQGRIDGWGPDPITGFYTIDAMLRGDWETLGQSLRYLALPMLTLALPAMATIVRFTRAGVLNVMSSNFVFYQTAMGHPAAACRLEVHPAQRADRHADADRADLWQSDRRCGGRRDGVRLARTGQFRGQFDPAIRLQRDHGLHFVRRGGVHSGEPAGGCRPGGAGPARPMMYSPPSWPAPAARGWPGQGRPSR